MPPLSVLMPVYNAADFLDESISSILNQTFSNFEFFILDDSSTDTSLQIIRSYAKQDKRIKVLVNKENKGEAKSRNILLKNCKTEFAALMDADDLSVKNRFQIQLNYLKKHPEVDILGAQMQYFGSDVSQVNTNSPKSDLAIKSNLLFNNGIYHNTIILRMVKIQQAKIFYDETLPTAPDYQYWVDCCPFARFTNLPDVLVKYRRHQLQVSKTKLIAQKRVHTKIVKEHIRNLGIKIPKKILENKLISNYKIKNLSDADLVDLKKLLENVLLLQPFYQYFEIDFEATLDSLQIYINTFWFIYKESKFCQETFDNEKKIIKMIASLNLFKFSKEQKAINSFFTLIIYYYCSNLFKTKFTISIVKQELQFIKELCEINNILTIRKFRESLCWAIIRQKKIKGFIAILKLVFQQKTLLFLTIKIIVLKIKNRIIFQTF